MTSPTPRRALRDTPRPESTHANSVCAGPGGGGHSYDRCDELFDSFHSCAVGIRPPFAKASGDEPPRPAGTPPQRGTLFRNGTGAAAISVVKGNLDRGGNVPSSPPLEGCRDTGPRATCRVGGWDGVVREFEIIHLLFCHSRLIHPINTFVFA